MGAEIDALETKLKALSEVLAQNTDHASDDNTEREKVLEEAKRLEEQRDVLVAKVTDQHVVKSMRFKLAKLRRKKRWRVRHIKKLRAVRDDAPRKREEMHKKIDQWRADRLAKEGKAKEEAKLDKQLQKHLNEIAVARKKRQDKVKLIERLQKLQSLRREKAKKKGHVFPEEDDQFFSRIQRETESLQLTVAGLQGDAGVTHAASTPVESDVEVDEKKETKNVPVVDPVHAYYYQAETVKGLVKIR
ncbi:hypothetical protein HK104_002241 [Borealophlyctis nickersoniae]|nr:hypothetical protein HK104_002241 [Borealophlyctis nickersoniae]